MHLRKIIAQLVMLIVLGFSSNADAFQDTALISVGFPGLIIGMLLALCVEALAWTRKSGLRLLGAIKKLGFVYLVSFIVYIIFVIFWARASNNSDILKYIGLGEANGIIPVNNYKPSASEIAYSITVRAVWFQYMPNGYKWVQYLAILVSLVPLYIVTVLFMKARTGHEERVPIIIKRKLLYIALIYISITAWLLITESSYLFAV